VINKLLGRIKIFLNEEEVKDFRSVNKKLNIFYRNIKYKI